MEPRIEAPDSGEPVRPADEPHVAPPASKDTRAEDLDTASWTAHIRPRLKHAVYLGLLSGAAFSGVLRPHGDTSVVLKYLHLASGQALQAAEAVLVWLGNSVPGQMFCANVCAVLVHRIWKVFVRIFLDDHITSGEQQNLWHHLPEFIVMSLVTWLAVVEESYTGPFLLYALWYLGIGAVSSLATVAQVRSQQPPAGRLPWLLASLACLNAALFAGMVAGLASDVQLLLVLVVDNLLIFAALAHAGLRMHVRSRTAAASTAGSAGGTTVANETAGDEQERLQHQLAVGDLLLDAGSEILRLLHVLHLWYLTGLSVFSVTGFFLAHMAHRLYERFGKKYKVWAKYKADKKLLDHDCRDATSVEVQAACVRGGVTTLECPVCLDDISSPPGQQLWGSSMRSSTGAVPKVLPLCGHIFHRRCVRQWIGTGHDTCPVCRRGMNSEIEAKRRKAEEDAAERERRRDERQAQANAGPDASRQTSPAHSLAAAGDRPAGLPRAPAPLAMAALGGAPQARVGHPADMGVDGVAPGLAPSLWSQLAMEISTFAGRLFGGAAGARRGPVANDNAPWVAPAVDAVMEMFPDLDRDAVRRLVVLTRGNTELAVEMVLQGRVPRAAAVAREDGPG